MHTQIHLHKLSQPRVLLIEDDRTTRRIVSNALGPHCNLMASINAGKGMSHYKDFNPDLVFLDLELPDGSGHDILQWIIRNDPGAYIVLFSANCDSENIEKARYNGAKGYVHKPFDLIQMMYHIQACPRLYN